MYFFTHCYASTASAPHHVSVSLSVTRPVLCRNDRTDRAGFFLAWVFPSTYVVREFCRIMYTYLWNFLQKTLDLENFSTASVLGCQHHSFMVELVDHT